MLTMGTTKIACKRCGATAEVKNEDLETLREYRCNNPGCNARMTDQQFANLKSAYYLELASRYNQVFGGGFKSFSYEIDINPKYTPDWAISAEMNKETVDDTDN